MSIVDIAYVVFDHADLSAAERFYKDFGLRVAYRNEREVAFRPALERGYCYVARQAEKQGLSAIAFTATDYADLEAAAGLPESSSVMPIEREGGGHKVVLRSPDGLPFEIVHGIRPYPRETVREALTFNTGLTKRRHGAFQRPPFEPAPILRLGHVALLTKDFKRNYEWMQTRLGLTASDIMYDGDESNEVGAFLHLKGGSEWTDHHSLALFPDPTPRVHHVSFEIEDLDAQGMGNKWLTARGWRHVWGIGRHIYGSQIFDYWLDPAGNIVEHYTDGDLVKPGSQPGKGPLDEQSLYAWGPPMEPAHFVSAAARHE